MVDEPVKSTCFELEYKQTNNKAKVTQHLYK